MDGALPIVDVAGVGLNATDTIIRLPHFPEFNSKVEFGSSEVLPGGQVASAMVACSLWGLKTRYVGKIGDDAFGRLQREAMERAGVECHWIVAPNCQASPLSFWSTRGTEKGRFFGNAIRAWSFGPRRYAGNGWFDRSSFMWMVTIAPGRLPRLGGLARPQSR